MRASSCCPLHLILSRGNPNHSAVSPEETRALKLRSQGSGGVWKRARVSSGAYQGGNEPSLA
eukprot:193319-Pelagomonas_calceolata.AAC.1